jgi:1,4-dihydroxy-2-naphthoate polyprenyltransferase
LPEKRFPPVGAMTLAAAPRHDIAPGSVRAWAVAVRPRTLWIAAVPVVVGTSLAWLHGAHVQPWVAVLALIASLLMQVVTNLQNDVGYTARGLETGQRVGMPRATAQGLLTQDEVRRAIVLIVVVSSLLGLPLVLRNGIVVLAIGLSSLLAALAYMGGPRPIAYTPYGELTVFVFFGLVAVLGTYYLHAGAPGIAAQLAAAAIGLHAAAVLAVNNHRDAEHDAKTGRRTFAARFGAVASARLFATMLWTPFALVVAIALIEAGPWLAAPVVLLPFAWSLQRDFSRCGRGTGFNDILLRTVKLELAFGALLSAGAVAQHLAAAP